MAITVTNSNTQYDDAETTTGWASDGGGGAGPQNEPDLVYQNTQSVSRKVGTTLGGLGTTGGTAVDMTAAGDLVVMLKGVWSKSAALVAAPSARHKIGSTTGNYYAFQIIDDGTRGDIDAPPTRLWVVSMINPNVAPWRDVIVGSANLASVDFFSIQGDFTGSAKAENVAMDAIDINPGLWLVGNTPDGTILDFQAHDEGTLTNRFGHIVTLGSTFVLQGAFVIGRNASATVSATTFTDSNRIIEFPGGRVDEGENVIEIDLGNASTVVTITAWVITGGGRSSITRWFDASDDEVDGTNNEVDIVAHGFLTGDAVTYSVNGTGAAVGGLTTTNEYFVRAVTVDAIALYLMSVGRDAAYTDTSRISLTAPGTGRQHSFTRTPVTWPDLTVTGNTGTCTFSGCTFNGINIVTLTSGATIEDSTFNGIILIDMADAASLDRVVINDQVTTESVALVTTPSPDDIVGCTFTASENGGHAIEVEATGTFSFSSNLFTGYGPDPHEFNSTDDITTATDVITLTAHLFNTGDAVHYNDRGGLTGGLVVDQDRYYVNDIGANSISLHHTRADAVADANRVDLTSGSNQTHAIESANAVILNSSGGLVTINVVSGGDRPTVRNTASSSTVVNTDVTVTFTGMNDGTEIRAYAETTTTEESGSVTANIESSVGDETMAIPASTIVDLMIHHIDYETIRVQGFTWPTVGQNFLISQRLDRNFSNP